MTKLRYLVIAKIELKHKNCATVFRKREEGDCAIKKICRSEYIHTNTHRVYSVQNVELLRSVHERLLPLTKRFLCNHT